MSKLLQSFREQMESGKDGYKHQEALGDVAYSTGFINIDYLNGYMVHVKNSKEDYYYPALGIPDGKSVMHIGQSHCGKSTLVIQEAANIIRPFKNGAIWHADLEGGTNDHRIEVLTGFSQNRISECYHYQDTNISSEVFYEQIKWLHDAKIANRKEYEYDTGLVNFRGDRIYKFEPTIYIIDSLPMLLPDNIIEDDKVSGQMSTTSTVKMNTFIFRKIQQLCKASNIIIMSINHILEDVQINPMVHKKSSIVGGLKQGERLPGGKTTQYLGNTMFRIDAGTKLTEDDSFGVNGFVATIQTAKSRSNESAKTIPMIFDKATGFNNDLSVFQLLKANNKIKGAGSYLYIGDRSDIKFSQRTLERTIMEYPELRLEMAKEALPILQSYLADGKDEGLDEDAQANDLNSLIRDMAMGKVPVVEVKNVSEEVVPKKLKKSKDDITDILSDMDSGNDGNI